MKRVVTALLAAAVAVPAVALLPSRIFFWVCLALFWGIAVEFEKLGRKLSPGVSGWIFLGVFPVVGASWAFGGDDHSLSLVALVAAPLIYAVGAFRAADDPRGAAIGLGWWSFGTPYLALPVWSMTELHGADPGLLLVLLISVWLNDAAAYYAGSRFGRHKLAPRLSPKKTIEGSVAGLLAAGVVGVVGARWLELPDGGTFAILVAVSAMAGQAGDLVESLLKRAAGVKDSGQILPGHGGLLDRMDAIILAAPVFYGLSALVGAP